MKIKWIFSVVLGGAMTFFSSCSKEVPELKPCKSLQPAPNCVCTYLLDPVCGCDGISYPNPCAAECNGIYVYSKGKCKS